jgi:hypothetical protein
MKNKIFMDKSLGLNEREYVNFNAQTVACGDWHLLEIDQETAYKLLETFVEMFVPAHIETEDFVNYIYRTVQNSILAFRGYPFETLQHFPPFSEFGKKNLMQLLKFHREKGIEAFENGFRRMFRDEWEERKPSPEIIKILSGDGQSIETPVRFSVDEIQKRIMAERWFITYHYGKEDEDWKRLVHYSTMQPKTQKMISNWNIRLNDGTTVGVYFDTNSIR